MKTLMAGVLGVALMGGGSFLVGNDQPADPNRPDGSGQIQCPRTGEWVSEDRCPLLDEKADENEAQPTAICPICPMCR